MRADQFNDRRHHTGVEFDPADYVPLSARTGWKRKVEVLPGPTDSPRPPHNPMFGRQEGG
jgi:hypothetical protein